MKKSPSEADFQRSVLRVLRARGIPVQKFQDSLSHGIPDLFVGGFGWVELKIPGGKVEGPQVMWAKTFAGKPLPVILLFPDGSAYNLARVAPGLVNDKWLKAHSGFESKIPAPEWFSTYPRPHRTDPSGKLDE